MPTKHSFALLENVVLRKPRPPHEDHIAREAIIDCLLIILEAADELGLQRTAEHLDVSTDFALSESRLLASPTLAQILRSTLESAAIEGGSSSNEPTFKSHRGRKVTFVEDTVATGR